MNPDRQKTISGSAAAKRPKKDRTAIEFFYSMSLAVITAVFLLGSLIYFAGPWNIAANTRLLDLLIKSGIVKYHDRNAGFVEGVADHMFYLKSQEPVVWTVILLAVLSIIAFWVLKAVQFHNIARYHGISGTFGRHARAYLAGLTYKKFMPFHVSDAAATAILQSEGTAPERVYSALFLFRLFVIFEIAVFSVFGLLNMGWSAWLVQILWALVVFGILYWWTRPAAGEPASVSTFAAAKEHLNHLLHRPGRLAKLGLLSIVAFGMQDIAAYLLTMAFSTQQVLLHVDFSVLLMAFVAGYIARQIPLSPGGIGQFEWAFTAALFLGGMGLPEAATVSLIYSFFYYFSFGVVYLITLAWRGAQVPFRSVISLVYNPLPTNGKGKAVTTDEDPVDDSLESIPTVPAPHMPSASNLWRKAFFVACLVLGVFFFNEFTLLMSNFWLLGSLELSDVFWTNFRMGATLFVIVGVFFATATAAPALVHKLSRKSFKRAAGIGALVGLLAGYWSSLNYQDYLLWANGLPFGERDPVFNIDIGFYAFTLPAWWTTWQLMVGLLGVGLISSAICAYQFRKDSTSDGPGPRLALWLGRMSTRPTLAIFALLGVVLAAGVWLNRYELLFLENKEASVFTGSSYIDVNGLFSTLNQIQFTAVIILGVVFAAVVILRALHYRAAGQENGPWPRRMRTAGTAILLLVAVDFAFALAVSIRNTIMVKPNQPVIQLSYIERHIAATRRAFGLDQVEEIEFRPRKGNDPLPSLEQVLSSGAIRNAPLWPTYVNYLERVVDPQHAQRILQTGGDNMIYGPTLETFRQQEKLRTYYDFLDVDVLRYSIDGEKVVLASSVRELPILEPQPWLAWWGQRFILFTHGHGLAMAPVGQTTPQGEPSFVSGQIPVNAAWPEITAANQQVYYGEGNASMAISNVRDLAELDYPTDQGRAENILPQDFPGGVTVNSFLKRFVFGWQSGEFWEMIFSTLITPETRIHFYRQPLQRLEHIAPFLYFEANPYATIVDGDITWLVNAVTVSDQYPYSKYEFLGDKSLSRSPQTIATQRINYVEDAVKVAMNAATGQVKFYKIADKPVINTWAAIYPSLFADGGGMPQEVRQQLTYPLQLFHIQFDDLYIYYHMNDPVYFFNMEDIWDDADEVLGPVLDYGRAITFSMEPYHMLVETGGVLPASAEKEQFAMTMVFTPEGARNLRAAPIVYQDGEDYGRLFVLMAPKGTFILGPEQADAIIDQEPEIASQISWWDRRGSEVIRGHTSMLLIEDEIIYVEPIFIRSEQNSMPQLKRVVVVVRGQAFMAETLEQALRRAFAVPLKGTDDNGKQLVEAVGFQPPIGTGSAASE